MIEFLNRFNPFYMPRDFTYRKYLTFNWFKGYQMFDVHFWKPQPRYLTDSEHHSKMIMMFGVTLFYFRLELFINWAHKGSCWRDE